MNPLRRLAWSLLSVFLFAPTAAVVLGEACPEVIRTALEATDQLCANTGRNQACYGHIFLEAQPQPGVASFSFEDAGDTVDVTAVRSLRLWPMEPDTGVWGVALMRLQADLPTSDNANITLLTFGDVQLENAVQLSPELEVTVGVNEYINVRRAPSTDVSAVGVLAPGQQVKAVERLADNSWLRVELPGSGVFGWVYTPLVTFDGDLDTLNIAEGWTPHYRPMQAFYFDSGAADSACGTTPSSGMLIQTPEGVGEVTLLINEVNIRIGSTVFFQAQAGGAMTVTTVEGHATVTANGVTQTAPAGAQLSVPLNEDMSPAGPPSRPEPYEATEVESLPITVLDREIEIAPPLTQEEIDTLYAPPVTDCGCGNGNGRGGNGTASNENSADCPGQSCNALGHGGQCPGNSCDNPGNAAGSGSGNASGNSNGRGNGAGNG